MFGFRHKLKTVALAGLGALAITAAAASPASAHERSFVRCGYYGHNCVRIVCDHDGDRCRRVAYYHGNYDRGDGYHRRDRHDRSDRYHRRDRYDHRDRYERNRRYDRNIDYRPVSGLFIGLNLHP